MQTAKSLRVEFKRYAQKPSEEKIRQEIIKPLEKAAEKISQRLRELNKENPLSPVSKDPVPEKYDDLVNDYFENLSK